MQDFFTWKFFMLKFHVFFYMTKTDHEDPLSYGLQTRKDLQLFFNYFETVFNRKFYIKQATFPTLSLDDSVQDGFIILAELLWCINFLLLVWRLCKIRNFHRRLQNQWTMRRVWCPWNPKFPNISNRKRCCLIIAWKRQMIFQTRTMFLIIPCFPCFVIVNLQIKQFFFWNQFFKERLHVTMLCPFVHRRFWFHRRTFLLMLLRFPLNSNIKVFWSSNNMWRFSRIFQNPCSLRCMNNRQSWMKNRFNPQVFILRRFFLHFSMRFPNNHRFHLRLVFFIDCQPVDFFDRRKFCLFCDQKCFQSKLRDKLRLRCNMELILVCKFHRFLWSNPLRPANLSTFRPSRFTSPFPFENLFCPFLPDFCTMHPLWIRFP